QCAVFFIIAALILFFFSSRRRHTRFSRDWSSDVCSSDLVDTAKANALAASTEATIPTYESSYQQAVHRLGVLLGRDPTALSLRQIGRASCRERVELLDGAMRRDKERHLKSHAAVIRVVRN